MLSVLELELEEEDELDEVVKEDCGCFREGRNSEQTLKQRSYQTS
jgi:hypothetical protein